jgi:osmotically-inducible protein OsmY
VTDGAVTLSGYVNNEHLYQNAYNAVKLTLGGIHVENNLKIVSSFCSNSQDIPVI